MRIAKLLKLYLSVNDISMAELGAQLGISKATISRVCTGGAVDASTLLKLMNWLFGEEV